MPTHGRSDGRIAPRCWIPRFSSVGYGSTPGKTVGGYGSSGARRPSPRVGGYGPTCGPGCRVSFWQKKATCEIFSAPRARKANECHVVLLQGPPRTNPRTCGLAPRPSKNKSKDLAESFAMPGTYHTLATLRGSAFGNELTVGGWGGRGRPAAGDVVRGEGGYGSTAETGGLPYPTQAKNGILLPLCSLAPPWDLAYR